MPDVGFGHGAKKWSRDAVEQGDEADEAFAGIPSRPKMPAHARAGPFLTRAPLRSLSLVFDGHRNG